MMATITIYKMLDVILTILDGSGTGLSRVFEGGRNCRAGRCALGSFWKTLYRGSDPDGQRDASRNLATPTSPSDFKTPRI